MVYTVSVPLANQKIAATQAPIQANFAFINSTLQLNHTFNGASVGGSPDGSHTRLDMPNQPADIAVLPANINAVQYARGAALYIYDGVGKQPVSGITLKGITSFTTTPTLLFTVPVECTGYIVFTSTQPPGTATAIISTIHFVSTNGRLSFSTTSTAITAVAVIEGVYTASFRTPSGSTTNTAWKAIYWPV